MLEGVPKFVIGCAFSLLAFLLGLQQIVSFGNTAVGVIAITVACAGPLAIYYDHRQSRRWSQPQPSRGNPLKSLDRWRAPSWVKAVVVTATVGGLMFVILAFCSRLDLFLPQIGFPIAVGVAVLLRYGDWGPSRKTPNRPGSATDD